MNEFWINLYHDCHLYYHSRQVSYSWPLFGSFCSHWSFDVCALDLAFRSHQDCGIVLEGNAHAVEPPYRIFLPDDYRTENLLAKLCRSFLDRDCYEISNSR